MCLSIKRKDKDWTAWYLGLTELNMWIAYHFRRQYGDTYTLYLRQLIASPYLLQVYIQCCLHTDK